MKNIEKYRDEYIAALKENAPCEFRRKYVLNREFCHGYEFVCEGCTEQLARWLDSEYIPQIDWIKVPKNTPIVATAGGCQLRVHFAFYEPKYVTFYKDGKTSWTGADRLYTVPEGKVKLALEEDIEKYTI